MSFESNVNDYQTLVFSCFQTLMAAQATDQRLDTMELRPGIQANPDISQFEDQCCGGFGYVQIRRIFPSSGLNLPDENPMTPCGPYAITVETEVAIFRCFPVGTAYNIPTTADQNAAALQQNVDYGYLFGTMCCVRTAFSNDHHTNAITFEDWQPYENQGGCYGSRIRFLAELECPNIYC